MALKPDKVILDCYNSEYGMASPEKEKPTMVSEMIFDLNEIEYIKQTTKTIIQEYKLGELVPYEDTFKVSLEIKFKNGSLLTANLNNKVWNLPNSEEVRQKIRGVSSNVEPLLDNTFDKETMEKVVEGFGNKDYQEYTIPCDMVPTKTIIGEPIPIVFKREEEADKCICTTLLGGCTCGFYQREKEQESVKCQVIVNLDRNIIVEAVDIVVKSINKANWDVANRAIDILEGKTKDEVTDIRDIKKNSENGDSLLTDFTYAKLEDNGCITTFPQVHQDVYRSDILIYLNDDICPCTEASVCDKFIVKTLYDGNKNYTQKTNGKVQIFHKNSPKHKKYLGILNNENSYRELKVDELLDGDGTKYKRVNGELYKAGKKVEE